MKKVLVLTVALLAISSMALAQGGVVGIYQTQAGNSCDLFVPAIGIADFYVVHHLTNSVGSQWRVDNPNPLLLLIGAFPAPGVLNIGDPATGVVTAYGGCFAGPFYVYRLTFFNQAFGPCMRLSIVEDPISVTGQVESVDCTFNVVVASGMTSYINGDGTCPCEHPLPVEETSWGKVKALYGQ